jgi:hypothetical protein
MGITISYRGRLADLTRIEDFEDRLLDFALEVGGLARIWRSHGDDDPQRMVRGVILDLAPGQEPTSLLIAPEGWLIGLSDIEDAERGSLPEPPWCFTKTQFGPLEGHVALVEMLAALRREFVPDLEVADEGGYWETHDLTELIRRRSAVQEAIDTMAQGLQRHGLSREAAEDQEILLRRIERIAAQVHRILRRPAEHPPVSFPEDDPLGGEQDPEAVEALWDELYKHNRRQQERMQRALEERRAAGEADDEAFDNAIGDLGLEIPSDDESELDEEWQDELDDPFAESLAIEPQVDYSDAAEPEAEGPFKAEDEERHPLLQQATDFMGQLHAVFRGADSQFASSLHTLFAGAGDMVGGLAQALSERAEDIDDHGLCITQLKRSLRGAAFARGALFSLRHAAASQVDELIRTAGQLEQQVFQELSRARTE